VGLFDIDVEIMQYVYVSMSKHIDTK